MLHQVQQSRPESISVDAWMFDDKVVGVSQQTQATEIIAATNNFQYSSSLSASGLSATDDNASELWARIAPTSCNNCATNNVECRLVPLDAPNQVKVCINCQNCKDWLPRCSFVSLTSQDAKIYAESIRTNYLQLLPLMKKTGRRRLSIKR